MKLKKFNGQEINKLLSWHFGGEKCGTQASFLVFQGRKMWQWCLEKTNFKGNTICLFLYIITICFVY